MISKVIKFTNDNVLVFDEKGEQMPEFEGKYQDVRVRILARAPRSARFFHGHWSPATWALVSRKDW